MLQQIATVAGVSRERVRQIAKKNGLITPKNPENVTSIVIRKCLFCKKELKVKRFSSKKYCSRKCATEYFSKKYWSKTQCQVCKNEIKYYRSSFYRKPRFCSKRCQGSYMGNNYKNKRIDKPFKLYVYECKKIEQENQDSYWSPREFLNQTGYSMSHITTNILPRLMKEKVLYKIKIGHCTFYHTISEKASK